MAEKPKFNVPYVRLGNSGLKVSRIILGTMQYGTSKWQEWVLSEEEAIEHIKLAYDAGIQTFDTANVYSNGLSEIILGKAIKQLQLPREEIVILTKVYFTVAREYATNLVATGEKPEDLGYVNQRGLNRKHIFDSVKASLQRLGVEYIDVLQCHRFDYETPIEETMQALHDVVKAGYVRYIGMSSCHAYQCTSPSLLLDSRLTTSLSQSTKCKTMQLPTISPRSSRCRTTIAFSIAKKSARCSPHSRYALPLLVL
ncbi:hypothetical protein H2248_002948 [Termitomyces sp. 'cryptogamus']|nr:hypothetical protein H2248_002948 [Termitomyces sp. 'cryptogamus']